MKKVIAVFLILAIALIAIFLVMRLKREELMKGRHQFNLSKPERQAVKINGKDYSFLLTKYDPPYSHTKLLASRGESDCSTPEETDLALWSAVGRDRDWYLSLFDEGAREHLLERDKKTGGKILEEYSKGKPLPDPQETGNYSKLMYKIGIKINNKEYVIIQEKRVHEGEEELYPSYMVFVKEGSLWLVTDDLKKHPIKKLVGLNSYEEIKQILKKGSWSVE